MGRKERVIKKHGHGYRVIGTHGYAFLREDLALKGCELSIFTGDTIKKIREVKLEYRII